MGTIFPKTSKKSWIVDDSPNQEKIEYHIPPPKTMQDLKRDLTRREYEDTEMEELAKKRAKLTAHFEEPSEDQKAMNLLIFDLYRHGN